MKHEKIFKKEDGSKVSITVRVWLDGYRAAVYNIDVSVCDAGKRKFRGISRDDYEYRSLSMPDRERAMTREYLKYVTAEELHAAKLELWEKLKPTP